MHPSLIPLLRGQFSGASDDVPGQAGSILLERRDDLAAVVGIARGVFAVCAVVAVAYVVY